MAKFEFIKNEIEGLVVIKPTVFGDDRGFFMETFHKDEFAAAGITREFVQDNHSKSSKGVLRGLHFQTENTQGKLVRVIKGEVFDVAVDCRPGSKTFGQWYGVTLSEENKVQFYVPEGFAHGFLVLSDEAEFVYKCTDIYNPKAEGGIPYNDETIGVQWPEVDCEIKLSEKDKKHTPFAQQKFEWAEKY
ncbi:MAG: dTDP-4-dehydrorhamnose 3,5-epimerase [Oscillospiraceae bacterium]|nr:dTDP-4-dehydrorhamnose 3,5-epimerase [Oscillospiraceae bacterium]MBQ6850390.1 dTDP-4-dehydrorhamnose 3,5-epimerase [Oscillospiraceae bacterium]MBR6609962.1 dTDP-4-dehydrorhamnose 3,5-epimerase [Oscillospiraceae bacterium]